MALAKAIRELSPAFYKARARQAYQCLAPHAKPTKQEPTTQDEYLASQGPTGDSVMSYLSSSFHLLGETGAITPEENQPADAMPVAGPPTSARPDIRSHSLPTTPPRGVFAALRLPGRTLAAALGIGATQTKGETGERPSQNNTAPAPGADTFSTQPPPAAPLSAATQRALLEENRALAYRDPDRLRQALSPFREAPASTLAPASVSASMGKSLDQVKADIDDVIAGKKTLHEGRLQAVRGTPQPMNGNTTLILKRLAMVERIRARYQRLEGVAEHADRVGAVAVQLMQGT